jgi:hypothetical protein
MRAQSLCGSLCFGLSLIIAGSCSAAQLQPIQGSVYVDQGGGWALVNGGQPVEVAIGNSVIVSPGGLATVTYPDGCKVGVKPGDIAPITRLSPCVNPFGNSDAIAQGAPPPPSDASEWWLGAGVGLGAAALGTAIYAISQHNSNTTVNGMSCGTITNPCWTSLSP